MIIIPSQTVRRFARLLIIRCSVLLNSLLLHLWRYGESIATPCPVLVSPHLTEPTRSCGPFQLLSPTPSCPRGPLCHRRRHRRQLFSGECSTPPRSISPPICPPKAVHVLRFSLFPPRRPVTEELAAVASVHRRPAALDLPRPTSLTPSS